MMTIKEFEEFRNNHTLAEFHKWFDQRTWYEIIIDDIPFPCIKISSKKVGLRNGSIFVIDNQVLRRLEMDEQNLLVERRAFLDVYENLQKEEKLKANTYISLLHPIKVLEDDEWTNRNLDTLRLLKNGDKTVRCAFCNKLQDQAKKVIAGPRGVFICDECVEICNEILAESEK